MHCCVRFFTFHMLYVKYVHYFSSILNTRHMFLSAAFKQLYMLLKPYALTVKQLHAGMHKYVYTKCTSSTVCKCTALPSCDFININRYFLKVSTHYSIMIIVYYYENVTAKDHQEKSYGLSNWLINTTSVIFCHECYGENDINSYGGCQLKPWAHIL